jgi:hypothetical protein
MCGSPSVGTMDNILAVSMLEVWDDVVGGE